MTGADRPRIGFVGIGLMGGGMAANILVKGWPLTVFDRVRARAQALAAKGAVLAESLADVARSSDIVFLSLLASEDVEQAVLGERGLVSSGAQGMVIVDTSTSSPASTVKVNAQVRAAGMLFCDAPLSRSPAEAAEGRLASVVAAEQALFDRLRPVISAYSEVIVYAGRKIGAAHLIKLANNFVALGFNAQLAEAFAACEAAGSDPVALRDFLSAGSLDCAFFRGFSRHAVDKVGGSHKFALANCEKDLRYYTQHIDDVGFPGALADVVYNIYKTAVRRGHGDKYVLELFAAVKEQCAAGPDS